MKPNPRFELLNLKILSFVALTKLHELSIYLFVITCALAATKTVSVVLAGNVITLLPPDAVANVKVVSASNPEASKRMCFELVAVFRIVKELSLIIVLPVDVRFVNVAVVEPNVVMVAVVAFTVVMVPVVAVIVVNAPVPVVIVVGN